MLQRNASTERQRKIKMRKQFGACKLSSAASYGATTIILRSFQLSAICVTWRIATARGLPAWTREGGRKRAGKATNNDTALRLPLSPFGGAALGISADSLRVFWITVSTAGAQLLSNNLLPSHAHSTATASHMLMLAVWNGSGAAFMK